MGQFRLMMFLGLVVLVAGQGTPSLPEVPANITTALPDQPSNQNVSDPVVEPSSVQPSAVQPSFAPSSVSPSAAKEPISSIVTPAASVQPNGTDPEPTTERPTNASTTIPTAQPTEPTDSNKTSSEAPVTTIPTTDNSTTTDPTATSPTTTTTTTTTTTSTTTTNTTDAPTTERTTVKPITTTQPPSPITTANPPSALPPVTSWTIVEDDKVVLRAELGVRIIIGDEIVDITNKSATTGSGPGSLVLTSAPYELSLKFTDDEDMSESQFWKLTEIAVKKDSVEVASLSSKSGVNLVEAHLDNSFACDSKIIFNLSSTSSNVTVYTVDFKVQPFMDAEENGNFGLMERCEADKITNNVIPIAVGAALAVLVVVVLVLYLIGRRKHQRGYQTV